MKDWLICSVLLLAAAGAAPAQESSSPLLAFVSNRTGAFGIYTVRLDGSDLTELSEDPAGDAWPAWSPDGSRIAFRRGFNRIMVMDRDGGNPVVLATFSGDNLEFDLSPVWSPDGSKVLFDTFGEHSRDIFVAAADGSGTMDLTPDGFDDSRPLWSPDGSWILFESIRPSGRGLYRMRADGGEVALVIENGLSAAWSPDGSRIAFVCCLGNSGGVEIHVVNLDGSDERDLTPEGTQYVLVPSWSPDGSKIAFTGLWLNHEALSLIVMGADGSNPSIVADNVFFDMQRWLPPAWSPDGGQLAFMSEGISLESADPEMRIVDLETGEVVPFVVDSAEDGDPQWAP
jgi:Tol biopolymer transport system component